MWQGLPTLNCSLANEIQMILFAKAINTLMKLAKSYYVQYLISKEEEKSRKKNPNTIPIIK